MAKSVLELNRLGGRTRGILMHQLEAIDPLPRRAQPRQRSTQRRDSMRLCIPCVWGNANVPGACRQGCGWTYLTGRKSAVKGMVVVVRALRCGEVVPQGRRAFLATLHRRYVRDRRVLRLANTRTARRVFFPNCRISFVLYHKKCDCFTTRKKRRKIQRKKHSKEKRDKNHKNASDRLRFGFRRGWAGPFESWISTRLGGTPKRCSLEQHNSCKSSAFRVSCVRRLASRGDGEISFEQTDYV